MISFRRQIGLFGAVQGVSLAGLGDQLNQILAGWAEAGASAIAKTAAARRNLSQPFLRCFMSITPQARVFLGETMSQNDPRYNRAGTCKWV